MSTHVVRAAFNDSTVRVYQAFSPRIAAPALLAGRFVPPFKMDRATWIKPSFNWMMHRSGFGSKLDQEVVLAIDITRDGFEWALGHAALSAFDPAFHASEESWRRSLAESPVRIQWDPERDWRLRVIPDVRAIQIGLMGEAVVRYVQDWIVRIEDVTPLARAMQAAAETDGAPSDSPSECEVEYPMRDDVRARIGGMQR